MIRLTTWLDGLGYGGYYTTCAEIIEGGLQYTADIIFAEDNVVFLAETDETVTDQARQAKHDFLRSHGRNVFVFYATHLTSALTGNAYYPKKLREMLPQTHGLMEERD